MQREASSITSPPRHLPTRERERGQHAAAAGVSQPSLVTRCRPASEARWKTPIRTGN